MEGTTILIVLVGYFALLMGIAAITSRKSDNSAFFLGNRQSPWPIVAFGMIGASLSGVTFISVPGWVGTSQFSYMQMVMGYLLGYLVIALVLMPVYYSFNVTSIYRYLEVRFGKYGYRTGAFFFLLSKIIGAGFRLFLVAGVLQLFVFESMGVPFVATVAITLALILVYTFRGGIRTIVWTDTLQTLFMLTSLVLTVVLVSRELGFNFVEMVDAVYSSSFATLFVWDIGAGNHFVKHFIGGAFIAATMTGMDQDMMQKNLSIRNLQGAQRNIYTQMPLYIIVNLVFLSLGVLLYLYVAHRYQTLTGIVLPEGVYPNEALLLMAGEAGLPVSPDGKFLSDHMFPLIAIKFLGPFVAIVFIIGLIAAAYSSADSALTALTTSFCVDFLRFREGHEPVRLRYAVHLGFTVVMLITILLFNLDKGGAVIQKIFVAATYTYGPLLGLFSFGLLTKRVVRDRWIPLVCVAAPVALFFLKQYETALLPGYTIGNELIVLNGALTFAGLWLISRPASPAKS